MPSVHSLRSRTLRLNTPERGQAVRAARSPLRHAKGRPKIATSVSLERPTIGCVKFTMSQASLHSLPALLDEAWREVMLDPARAGELGRQIVYRARLEADPLAEAYGVMHTAYHHVRTSPLEIAQPAVDYARRRCAELGSDSAVRLCDDMLGFLAVRRGDFETALRIGELNQELPTHTRPPREQAITLLLLHTACHQSLRFDAALRYGHKHLAMAEMVGDIGQQAMALNNLSAVHLNVFNVEDALPFQQRANAIWTALQTRARLGLSVNNLVAICDALEMHHQAYEAVQTWLNQPGGVDAEDLHHYNSRIALALMGVGMDDEAERHLVSGPFDSLVNPRTRCWWTWTMARLRNRQRRCAEARELCLAYLDTRDARPIKDSPYDIVQLWDAVRIASEGLGDRPRAIEAARQAHIACVPMVGSSVRARYVSMLLQRDPDLQPAPDNAHGRRLEVLGRTVQAYEAAVEQKTLPPSSPPPAASPASPTPFLAHVSHEMRAPLNGMMGMTSLLLLSDLDDRQRRLATLAQSSAQVLLRLVNDILDLAKMESGRFALDAQPFALEPLVTDLVEIFRIDATAKAVALTLDYDASLRNTTRIGDPLRLRQVLTNLLSNAVKFTSKGQISVGVAARNGGMIEFDVRDSGKGIGKEGLTRLFTEFAQEDASIAREYGGTGLGLAVSQQLVRLMGGSIGVESEPGVGSHFWFTAQLPAVQR